MPPAPHSVRTDAARPRAPRAFTLTELLTVIAIVGILAAILIPVSANIRKSSLRAECGSNLRQIGNAANLHAADNQGLFPRAYTNVGGVETWWRETLVRGGYFGPPNLGLADGRPQSGWHASHFTYLTCRAHRQTVPITRAEDEWLRPTYSMNGTMTSGEGGLTWRPRANSYPHPSRLAFVADGPPPSGTSGVVLNPAFWADNWKPDATRAHDGAANILFFDGHLETRNAADIPSSASAGPAASAFWTGR